MGERIGRRRTVRMSWGVSRWEGRGSVVVSQHRGGKEDCGVRLGGSGTCRITGWNERNPCQWTSLALPIFIVPASKACFPSVFPGKDRGDSLIRLSSNEIRLTTSGGILFPFFSIPQFPTGLLYLTSYLPDLFLFFSFPRFKEGKEDQESARKNFSQERILISLINLHIYTWVSSFVCIESRNRMAERYLFFYFIL